MLTSMSHTSMRFSSLPSFIAFISSTQVISPASSPSHFVQVFNVIGSKLQGWGHLWHQHPHNCHCTHPRNDKMIVIVHLTPISTPLAECFVCHSSLVRSSLFVCSLFLLGFYSRFGLFAKVSELGIGAFSQYICFSGRRANYEFWPE